MCVFPDNSTARTVLYRSHGDEPYEPSVGLGFFTNQTSNSFILAIYMVSLDDLCSSSPVVLWSANRDHPVQDDATLDFTLEGNLVLWDADGSFVWSTNTSRVSVKSMSLDFNGNLILFNGKGESIWEAYDYPTDTLVVKTKYGGILPTRQRITSRISTSNYSRGMYYVSYESNGFHAFVDLNPPKEYRFLDLKSYNAKLIQLGANNWMCSGCSFFFVQLDENGHLNAVQSAYNTIQMQADLLKDDVYDDCVYPTACGKYGVCKNGNQCSCPSGKDDNSLEYFRPYDVVNTGCRLVTPLNCQPANQKLHSFLEIANVSYFDSTPFLNDTDAESCKTACLNQCSCKAVFFRYYDDSSSGNCTLPSELLSLVDVSGKTLGYNVVAFIKVQNTTAPPKAASSKRKWSIMALFLIIVVSFTLCMSMWMWMLRRRKSRRMIAEEIDSSLDICIDSVSRFSYESLKLATQDFQTRLGRGGFGSVFEGILVDGTKVAVKRLDSLGQGRKEFLAEVNTIGSLHHFNSVSLIGFCDDGSNRLLVYEYMCNGSLEKWIFKQDTPPTLTWQMRRRIIDGVAAGLEYLHGHCKQNVIHFDIKPQNILLDKDFNVKISDFGLAKMVDRDLSQVMTMVRGTPGYMAPELTNGCAISVKVDVYSFGIVVLEIVCGRRNIRPFEGDCLTNLVKAKADLDQLSDLIDEHAEDMQQNKEEVVKMMKIAIW